MKYYETHFEEYLNENSRINLHPKLDKIYEKFPAAIKDLKNVIFFGPSGVGKYTQMLKSIRQYSPSNLKYEKKLSITYNKQQYLFKISDIHYEIDMSLLGCNAKLLWYEIYQQIIDIIVSKTNKHGIIVCNNFQNIHIELLDNLYSYMQKQLMTSKFDIKFIIITTELSFIPDNIINCCEVINIARPSKTMYNKISNIKTTVINLEEITNIKFIRANNEKQMLFYKCICNKIIKNLLDINNIQFIKLRDLIYDIFIYNLDITECVWYIITSIVASQKINTTQLSDILKKTYCFFQYYNNNYRPIYHVEKIILEIATIIHDL